jgi:plasmid segregation protein ParM
MKEISIVMSQKIGVDVGFGNTKGRSIKRRLDFSSLVGEFTPVRFSTGMEDLADPTTSLAIEYQGERYYVGQAALKQSTPQNTIEQTRTVTKEGLILLLTAIMLLAEDNSPIDLVVGLPVNHYVEYKQQYIDLVKGSHHVRMLKSDGSVKTERILTIQNVKVLPQPFGAIFDLILGDDGKLIDAKLANGKLAVIDIGYNTTDLVRADALEFINNRSTSFSGFGMFSAYRQLSDIIYHEHKIEILPEKLEPIVQKGVLNIYGKVVPIAAYKQQAFKTAANNILSKVKTIWVDSYELDRIALAGGGSANLGELIAASFPKEQIAVHEFPMYANVNGYYKCAVWSWRD